MLLQCKCFVMFDKQCDMHMLHSPDACAFSSTMGQVYSEHRDEDGFLYVAYSGENTFGHCNTRWQRLLSASTDSI